MHVIVLVSVFASSIRRPPPEATWKSFPVRPDQTGGEISPTSLKYATYFLLLIDGIGKGAGGGERSYFSSNLEIPCSFQTHVLPAEIHEVITA